MKTIIIMPAYNADHTIKKTVENIPKFYSQIILCDDKSQDNTLSVARNLGIEVLSHQVNKGYGANQKTLYNHAKKYNPDILTMVHPDNQYDTSILPDAVRMIKKGEADVILGSRMQTARENGMPWWKILGNRFLSLCERIVFSSNLSEYHSGLRFFKANLLETMPYNTFSDDFVFDSQFLAWCFGHGKKVKEIPTNCYYNNEVSSVNFKQSMIYGFKTLNVLVEYSFSGKYHETSSKRI